MPKKEFKKTKSEISLTWRKKHMDDYKAYQKIYHKEHKKVYDKEYFKRYNLLKKELKTFLNILLD